MIGNDGGLGEESFNILVCSPSWLESEQLTKGFRWGHAMLVMRRWDPEVLERAVHDLVSHAERDSWQKIGEYLSRYAHWEFADYRG
jgi:Immunity protein 8